MLSDSFLEFIKSEKLFEKNEPLLLAVSGGLDSVVLAHLLSQNGFRFTMAHMNFQLRGNDSIQDEEFVRKLAEQLDVEIFIKKVEINKSAGSTQLQARNLRYAWFKELMQKQSIHKLLTAHHGNDMLETALLNFIRGTGIKGLRSILPVQNDIARPLLFAEKSDLMQFAIAHKIEWRDDISNASENYTRNKIRHQLIPRLLDINPNLLSGFQKTSIRLRATEEAWNEKLQNIYAKYVQKEGETLKIDRLIVNQKHAIVYLSEMLSDYGFSLVQLQSFDFNRIGAQQFSSTHILTVDRAEILITKMNEKWQNEFFPKQITSEENNISTPFGMLKFRFINVNKVDFGNNQNLVFIDFKRLREPLELDLWQEGDKIQPLGMAGKKKISDILIDQKVPLPKKDQTMVLKSGGEIVWVIGYKFSELFKVKPDTDKIVQIEYYENS